MARTVLDDVAAVDRLAEWCERATPGFVPPITSAEVASAGRSNMTLVVRDGAGAAFVLRHPPLIDHDRTSHDVIREGRIMQAVGASDVPVPQVLGLQEDAKVIGVPFFLMRLVDGRVLDAPGDAAGTTPADRLALNRAMATHLAVLHQIDPSALGLSWLGRPEGYIDRQLRRWSKQWRADDQVTTKRFERCLALLERARPDDLATPRIVHGDYRLGNVIVEAGRVAAVLDWELTTLGHPLSDLAYLLNNWVSGEEAVDGPISSPTEAGGFGSRADLVAAYEAASCAPVNGSALRFFRAFSYWRLASIRSGVVARLATVEDPVVQERVAQSRRSVPQLIDAAMDLISPDPKEGM